jgi:hypothetical protein
MGTEVGQLELSETPVTLTLGLLYLTTGRQACMQVSGLRAIAKGRYRTAIAGMQSDGRPKVLWMRITMSRISAFVVAAVGCIVSLLGGCGQPPHRSPTANSIPPGGASGVRINPRVGHAGMVFGTAASNDGRLIAAGGRDVRIWDVETFGVVAELSDLPSDVRGVALSDEAAPAAASRPERPMQGPSDALGSLDFRWTRPELRHHREQLLACVDRLVIVTVPRALARELFQIVKKRSPVRGLCDLLELGRKTVRPAAVALGPGVVRTFAEGHVLEHAHPVVADGTYPGEDRVSQCVCHKAADVVARQVLQPRVNPSAAALQDRVALDRRLSRAGVEGTGTSAVAAREQVRLPRTRIGDV